jgi:hypothetical protein
MPLQSMWLRTLKSCVILMATRRRNPKNKTKKNKRIRRKLRGGGPKCYCGAESTCEQLVSHNGVNYRKCTCANGHTWNDYNLY